MQNNFTRPIRGSLTYPNLHVYDCRKRFYSYLVAKGGGAYPHKFKSMTPNVADEFHNLLFHSHNKGESYPPKLQCITPNVANDFSITHYKGGSYLKISVNDSKCLPIQTPLHDSNCCKRIFSFLLASRESYTSKLNSMTPIITNVFSHSH